MEEQKNTIHKNKPEWLKTKLPSGNNYLKVKNTIAKHNLHTICSSGKCPNLGECWGAGTATFMILGDTCTRSCKFCATKTGIPKAINYDEPNEIAHSVKLLNLKHCVITSVDRDDLEDYGTEIWINTITQIKNKNPRTTIEVLIPDFNGKRNLIEKVIKTKPNIISHNLETVKRLTPIIRNNAKYNISLKVLRYISESDIKSKSGLMVGLGETEDEIFDTMQDIFNVGCKILTIGQYLQPTKNHWPVHKYITPEEFLNYKKIGIEIGFEYIESGPLVRSSYHAENHVYL